MAAVLVLCVSTVPAHAQQAPDRDYEFDTAPDLWFNSVDGIRAGIRLRGQMADSFGDGPHRLDAGLWLSTFFPDYPVSYYISFTEPIPSLSGFNSEGNLRLRSAIRTGYHNHSVSFNKRWQPGFEETNYRELSVSLRAEKRFEDEYVLYPSIWQNDWLYITGVNFRINNANPLGRYRLDISTAANVAGPHDSFVQGQAALEQLVTLGSGFAFRGRLFAGLSSEQAAPEYRYTRSFQPYHAWDELGSTRAKGTLPTPWVRDGLIQVEGGANVRGYTGRDIDRLNDGEAVLHHSVGALNLELEYPNPVDRMLNSIPFAGLLNFRSYLFYDAGTSWSGGPDGQTDTFAGAGPGFMLSIDIPDYLGKSRGFALRYEMPLWLSDPDEGEDAFRFRSLIGIGAVISL